MVGGIGLGYWSVFFQGQANLREALLVPLGGGVVGGGSPLVSPGGGVGVSLSCSWSCLSLSLFFPPSPLLNPGETLIWPGWQSPSGFGPRRAHHGYGGEEWGWRSWANDSYEGGPWKYTPQLLFDSERGTESGSMHSVQLLLAMQGLWSHETATLWVA